MVVWHKRIVGQRDVAELRGWVKCCNWDVRGSWDEGHSWDDG